MAKAKKQEPKKKPKYLAILWRYGEMSVIDEGIHDTPEEAIREAQKAVVEWMDEDPDSEPEGFVAICTHSIVCKPRQTEVIKL